MIKINYDTATSVAKFDGTAVIKAGADVPVQITFSAAPTGEVTSITFALGTDASTPAVLAYTEDFTSESDTVWAAVLDANDTRLITFLSGKGTTLVKAELSTLIDGTLEVTPNLDVTVQKRLVSGDPTGEGGPSYFTEAQVTALLAGKLAVPTGITVGTTTDGAGLLISGATNLGTLYFQNTNAAGYPAIAFVDNNGDEHGAIGIGNSAGSAISQNVTFVESSDLRTSAGTPRDAFKIFQSSNRGYPTDSYQATRFEYGANLGDIIFHAYKPTTHEHAFFTLSSVGLTLSGDVSGYNTNRLIGINTAAAIVFSGETAGTGHDRNEYWSYGDTLANTGGHVFSTGGVQGSQTKKLVIANDYTSFKTTPVLIEQYLRFGSTSGPIDAIGTGSPEGVLGGPVGSTYRRTDGGAGTSFYVKESGSGNTGWVGK